VSAMLAPQFEAYAVARAATEAGIAVEALDRSGQRRLRYNGLTFGLGLIRDDEVAAGVRALVKLLG